MSLEENKAVVRRFLEEVAGGGNLDLLEELVAVDVVDHNPQPGQSPGIEGVREALTGLRAAFPDMRGTIEDMIAEAG